MWVGIVVALASIACGRIAFDPRSDANEGPCPLGYTSVGERCFRVERDDDLTPTWHEFELKCEADAVGAHLIVIDDASELADLTAHMIGINVNDAALGCSYRNMQWLNIFGFPAFVDWRVGEPGGIGCCAIDASSGQMWSAGNAGGLDVAGLDYVCEYDGLLSDPASF